MSNLFYRAINIFFRMMRSLIIIRVLLSYFRSERSNFIFELIFKITEPILEFSRNIIYKIGIDTGIFDFSPILAFIIMDIIEGLIRRVIF